MCDWLHNRSRASEIFVELQCVGPRCDAPDTAISFLRGDDAGLFTDFSETVAKKLRLFPRNVRRQLFDTPNISELGAPLGWNPVNVAILTSGHGAYWVYVDDHAQALIQVLEQGRVGETYNIGGSAERRNIDVAAKTRRRIARDLTSFIARALAP